MQSGMKGRELVNLSNGRLKSHLAYMEHHKPTSFVCLAYALSTIMLRQFPTYTTHQSFWYTEKWAKAMINSYIQNHVKYENQ